MTAEELAFRTQFYAQQQAISQQQQQSSQPLMFGTQTFDQLKAELMKNYQLGLNSSLTNAAQNNQTTLKELGAAQAGRGMTDSSQTNYFAGRAADQYNTTIGNIQGQFAGQKNEALLSLAALQSKAQADRSSQMSSSSSLQAPNLSFTQPSQGTGSGVQGELLKLKLAEAKRQEEERKKKSGFYGPGIAAQYALPGANTAGLQPQQAPQAPMAQRTAAMVGPTAPQQPRPFTGQSTPTSGVGDFFGIAQQQQNAMNNKIQLMQSLLRAGIPPALIKMLFPDQGNTTLAASAPSAPGAPPPSGVDIFQGSQVHS